MTFYLGFGLQLIGFSMVGLCFFSGVTNGNYGKLELIQLVGGSLVFYFGEFIKTRIKS
jgi:hypothetical protein